jgi:hypothetical protein
MAWPGQYCRSFHGFEMMELPPSLTSMFVFSSLLILVVGSKTRQQVMVLLWRKDPLRTSFAKRGARGGQKTFLNNVLLLDAYLDGPASSSYAEPLVDEIRIHALPGYVVSPPKSTSR